ncbi:MAG: hypothetical protein WCT41_00440 [Candidatus Paceibacterota bacterium]|jgi:hypothetical protein
MGERILPHWRVLAATLFSAVLVVGAYILARGIESPSLAQASTETALLQAIASKDSDSDGLPDWEEALYGADPHATDTFHLGMTDGEAVAKGLIVPKAIADIQTVTSTGATSSNIDYAANGVAAPTEGSLTDAFSKNFFSLYVAAKQANGGADLTDAQIQDVENQALKALTTSVAPAPDFKSLRDLTISGGGAEALKAFAVDAEAIFLKNSTTATTSELVYLQYAVDNNDTVALTHLAAIAKAYRNGAAGLSALTVPRELAAQNLALVNALMRISEVINDFAHVNADPLTAMLALQQYLPASQALGKAFADIGDMYAAAGVTLPAGTPGALFLTAANKL